MKEKYDKTEVLYATTENKETQNLEYYEIKVSDFEIGNINILAIRFLDLSDKRTIKQLKEIGRASCRERVSDPV